MRDLRGAIGAAVQRLGIGQLHVHRRAGGSAWPQSKRAAAAPAGYAGGRLRQQGHSLQQLLARVGCEAAAVAQPVGAPGQHLSQLSGVEALQGVAKARGVRCQ